MRELNFNDGFTSANPPDLGFIEAGGVKCFASDAAFEAYKGSPGDCGNEYFNTTSSKFRYHDGTIWRDLVSGTPFYQETLAGTSNGVNLTFGPFTYAPSDTNAILVLVNFAAVSRSGWTYSGGNLVFNAGWAPDVGQIVYVYYPTEGIALPPGPSGAMVVDPRVITLGEETAKQLTLTATPAVPAAVILSVPSGIAFYGVDYSVSGSILTWSGLGLDGFLITGVRVVIIFVS